MCNITLNITSGEYFNRHFLSENGGVALPFCEAMMDGQAMLDIFSEAFIAKRLQALHVTKEQYQSKMYVYDALQNREYQSIALWFGKDTFCQMNLLTLLAYLEQINYQGEVKLHYIDDETFAVIEKDIAVVLGIYRQIYQDIFISKSIPKDLGVLSKRAIALYFDYHSQNGHLANLVKANRNKARSDILCLLLEASKDYGLSDIQAEQLIATHLPK